MSGQWRLREPLEPQRYEWFDIAGHERLVRNADGVSGHAVIGRPLADAPVCCSACARFVAAVRNTAGSQRMLQDAKPVEGQELVN